MLKISIKSDGVCVPVDNQTRGLKMIRPNGHSFEIPIYCASRLNTILLALEQSFAVQTSKRTNLVFYYVFLAAAFTEISFNAKILAEVFILI